MARYRILPSGVHDTQTGLDVFPSGAVAWRDYLLWLQQGNVPDPLVIDPVPLADRQAVVWTRIKERREQIKHGGVQVAGKWYHSDEPSRVQQIGLVMMGANVPAVPWKTMDGSFETMTPAIASGIFAAVAALDMAAFAAAEAHRAALLAVPDPENYDFTAGWPAVFQN